MKKNNSKMIIVLLGIIIVALVGYIVYDKVFVNNQNNSFIDDSKTYNISDYVSVTDYEFNKNCIDCGTYGTVKKVEFKSLPLGTINEFESKHNEFINPTVLETAKLSNEVNYEINKNILSVYTKETKSYDYETQYDYYSLNVNLNNNKIITNQELLNLYNIKSTDVFTKILTNISNTIKTDKLLLSTIGDVTAETITIDKFKDNIIEYASSIDNRYDIVTLYIKDNKLIAVYNQYKILYNLGMGTHMGIGLVSEPQSIELN